jgi:hypothetical protein
LGGRVSVSVLRGNAHRRGASGAGVTKRGGRVKNEWRVGIGDHNKWGS